jgi:integrase
MARKATGQLIRRATGWFARMTMTVEGERIRVMRDLGTENRAVARKRLERLLAADNPQADVRGPETFEEAARRVIDTKKVTRPEWSAQGLGWLERFVFEHVGPMPVTKVKPSHISAVLETVRDAGKSRMSCHHVRQWCRTVFKQLVIEEVLAVNPCDAVVMPDFPRVVVRERAVLTDHELALYLAYEPEDGRAKSGTLERQVLAICSRVLGGARRGDLHALKWGAFELESFKTVWVPRRKTARPQAMIVPEVARPILDDWYTRNGSPGPEALVFPVRRGHRAGGKKVGVSHAAGLRRDLQAAFGAACERGLQAPAKGSARWQELFEECEHTRPVDFHSFRRGFVQALGDAGVNAQLAQQLAGHASLEAHARYLKNSGKLREIPAAALPQITIAKRQTPLGSAGVSTRSTMYKGGIAEAEMPAKKHGSTSGDRFLNRRSQVRILPGTPENKGFGRGAGGQKAAALPNQAAYTPPAVLSTVTLPDDAVALLAAGVP